MQCWEWSSCPRVSLGLSLERLDGSEGAPYLLNNQGNLWEVGDSELRFYIASSPGDVFKFKEWLSQTEGCLLKGLSLPASWFRENCLAPMARKSF